ncbi:MAG TPA: hypothetical protein VFM42_06180 [Sphingomicrobium sp.]|nr:hypothetical protein [Sphingomicrobium sp.]
MESEATSIRGNSTGWVIGCAGAALRDRLWRERWLLAALIGLPLVDLILQRLLFFPVVWAGEALGLPRWTFIAVDVFIAFPLGFILAQSMPRRRALVTALLCGVLFAVLGVVEVWITFGEGPEIWFRPGSQINNMTPILGWTIGISAWVLGAAIGSVVRPRTGQSKPDGA